MEMDFFAATSSPAIIPASAPSQQSATGSQPQMGSQPPESSAAQKMKQTVSDEDFPFEKAAEHSAMKASKEKRRSAPDDEDEDEADHARAADDDGFMKEEASAKKKKRKRLPEAEEHEPDEEKEDAEDDGFVRPPRRSFASTTATSQLTPKFKNRPPAKKDLRQNLDEDDDEDHHHPSPSASPSMLDADVNVFGFQMKRKVQLILIGLCLLLCPAIFQVIGALFATSSGLFPQTGQPSSADMGLSGDWNMLIQEGPNRIIPSRFSIDTYNGGLIGQGVDTDSGMPYQLKGQLIPPNKIAFYKSYPPRDPQHPDKPIVYQGIVNAPEGQLPQARGQWSVTKGVGVFLNRQTVTMTGAWQANLVHVRPAGWTGAQPGATGTTNVVAQAGGHSATGGWGPETFGKIVVFLLIGAIILVVVVWQLFSPNGILAVREKARYVPSQYRPDHRKMLKIMSKPITVGSLPLGIRCEWAPWKFWEKKEISLSAELRRTDPHVLVLGSGDKGKTRYIAHMVAHDIESNDRAIVVVDSDGSLIEALTRWMSHHPKGKMFAKRVVMLDPTNKNGSLAYNPLEMPDDGDLQAAASSLVYGFKAIYTEPPGSQSQWNAQTANILRNSALLLMANGKTLTDLPTLLQDNDFRDILLENVEKKKKEKVEYTTLIDTWGQYKRLARTDQWINWVEPILNRVGPMLSDPRIRPILTKAQGDIKLTSVIKNKQILMVKIARGQLDQNANLLGSLIVTGIKQAALALSGDPGAKPVSLYMDEFDNLIEQDTIDAITTETERYQLGLVGSIKTLQHLPEDFRTKIISNVGSWCCFALSKKDADLLGPQMFRVDGRKIRHQTMANFFNPVNTTPQFELITDEEKLNIDRVVGQDSRRFYCYRVGTQAGVFHLKSHDFKDLDDKEVNWKLIEKMHSNAGFGDKEKDKDKDKVKTS
jgi:hypothetical protein